MYCGNNRLNRRVLSGEVVIGNRYDCFRRGVGLGLKMPIDLDDEYYEPLDDKRVYCGKSSILPAGYDSVGNLPTCLIKGVGVGKRITREKGLSSKSASTTSKRGISQRSPRKQACQKAAGGQIGARCQSRNLSRSLSVRKSPDRRKKTVDSGETECHRSPVKTVRKMANARGLRTSAPTKKELCEILGHFK